METELPLRIVLVTTPIGVAFGLQNGKGSNYETIQRQTSKGNDLSFSCTVTIKDNRADGLPNFLGPLTQGPAAERFIYIGVGKLAGQPDSCWERRIKVPLGGITWEMIHQAAADPGLVLEAQLPGTGREGGPSCATVRPIKGWTCGKR